MKFSDRAPLSGVKRTKDGYVVAEAFAVRSGIQLYSGAEVGRPDLSVVRVFRPADEVKDPASLATFSHAPITLGHPTQDVTADNWKDLAVGEVSTEAEWRDNKIKLPLIIKDAAAVKQLEEGTRELSAGYTCELHFGDGVSPDGQPYDATQRNIRVNHLAIVPQGRAGSECRIGDSAADWGPAPLNDGGGRMPDQLIPVVLGDRAANVNADVAPLIQQFVNDSRKALADAQAAHAAALAAKDGEIATLTLARDQALAQVMDAAALDKRVADRADLISQAKRIAPDIQTGGLTDAAIRKAVVVKARPQDADKSDAYYEAAFAFMADAKRDTVGDAMGAALRGTGAGLGNAAPANLEERRKAAQKARDAHTQHLTGGYIGGTQVEKMGE